MHMQIAFEVNAGVIPGVAMPEHQKIFALSAEDLEGPQGPEKFQ